MTALHVLTERLAVIAQGDHQGSIGKPFRIEPVEEPLDLGIHEGDLAVIGGGTTFGVGRGRRIRMVRIVVVDPGEEGFVPVHRPQPGQGAIGHHIPGDLSLQLPGLRSELAPVLADHDDVDGVWYLAADGGGADVERRSAGNLKRTWIEAGPRRAWDHRALGSGAEFLRAGVQVKNVWVPYGA